MAWSVFEIKESGGRTAPFVSIGRGQLDFSAEACKLIGDMGNYKYVQILTDKENGKPVVGVKFLEEFADNCIAITRKTQNGKLIRGITVRNKGAIERLFGKDGTNNGMVRYPVELDDENILKIKDK